MPGKQQQINFGEFWNQKKSIVFRKALMRTKNREAAKDLSQDVAEKLWRQWDKCRGSKNPHAYFSTIMISVFNDYHRKQARQPQIVDPNTSDTIKSETDLADEQNSLKNSIKEDERHFMKEIFETFKSKKLNEEQRVVFNLSIMGYNMREIGEILSKTFGWVRHKCQQIEQALRNFLLSLIPSSHLLIDIDYDGFLSFFI